MRITDGHPEPRRSRPHPLAATLPRRRFLALGAGLLAAPTVAACASRAPSATPIGPTSPLVASAEQARQRSGAKVVTAQLTASPTTIDLGGVAVQTWAFNSQLPGPEIRLARGEVLRAELRNGLPQPSTIHWHGVALRNDMDGVPGLTQAPVAPQNTFTYDFTAPDAGTYWMHPHVGMQFDRGLYAPVVVTDPGDPGNYDVEAVIVVDDWLDGVAGDPDQRLEQLRKNGMAMGSMAMGSMAMGGPSDPTNPLGPDTGDVKDYPYYLINGRISTDPVTVAAKPGQRLKLRIINAGADTAFRVALGGHRLTITDSDGFPVNPTDTSSVLMGMGERYDALVTLGDGVFPLVANAEGKQGHAMAVVRTGAGSPPAPGVLPAELAGAPLTAAQLTSTAAVRLSTRVPDRTSDLVLGMDPSVYRWTINGKTYGEHTPLDVVQGERVRLRFVNQTGMQHPMHLHGHTYQVVNAAGTGPRKDTSIVLPAQTVEVDLQADNPGQWLLHCHNLYHGEAGMMTVLSYVQ